jgi:hypothetical protein
MLRYLLLIVVCFFAVSSSGCRLFGLKPLCGNRDWSSRERDRDYDRRDYDRRSDPPRIRDRDLIRPDDNFLRSPEITPTTPDMTLPPVGGSGSGPRPFIPESQSRRIPELDSPSPRKPAREILLPDDSYPGLYRKANPGDLLGSPLDASEPERNDRTSNKPAFDVNQWSQVKANILNGKLPSLSELDKLKNNGYRTVAYLHSPNADVSSVQRDVESKGMRFVGIPVSTDQIGPSSKSFNNLVSDKSNQPLFVCDDNGLRSGSMWYLYFRKVEFTDDDTATLLSTPLGLSKSVIGDSGEYWLAIRNYLSNN